MKASVWVLLAVVAAAAERAAAFDVRNGRLTHVAALRVPVTAQSFKKNVWGGGAWPGNKEGCPYWNSQCTAKSESRCNLVTMAVYNRQIDTNKITSSSTADEITDIVHRVSSAASDGAAAGMDAAKNLRPAAVWKAPPGTPVPDAIIAVPGGATAYANPNGNWYSCWNPPCIGDDINFDGSRGPPIGSEYAASCPELVVDPACSNPQTMACGACALKYGVVPGKSWGTAPLATRGAWGPAQCDIKICAQLSTTYGIVRGQTFGTAPAPVQGHWMKADCDYDCGIVPLLCGNCAIKFGIKVAPELPNRWGNAPAWVQAAWAKTTCDSNRQACDDMRRNYKIVPGVSWGSAPPEVKATYSTGC